MAKIKQSVDDLVLSLNSPHIELIHSIRKLIKSAGPELVEGIKWNAPSYSLNGTDIITLNFHDPGYVMLVFHTGPKGKDTYTHTPLFSDETHLLEWAADKRALLKIRSVENIKSDQEKIAKLIVTWVEKAKNSFNPL